MEEPQPQTTAVAQSSPTLAGQPTGTHKKLLLVLAAFGVGLAAIILGGVYYVTTHTTSQKVYHVGILNALDYFSPAIDGFKQKMTELGYVEGKNITYDIQKGAAPVGNQAIVKKFVDDRVDLIFSFPTEASVEAKEGTKGTNIPIVSMAIAVEGNKLVDSVQKPGGNLTGVRFPIPEVAAKRLEVLHELAPKATHILVPYLKDYPTVSPSLSAAEDIANELHLTLLEVPFSTPDEVAAYLALHKDAAGIDAVLTIPEPISILPPFIDQIYDFAEVHKIPVAGTVVTDSEKGPIFSLIPNSFEMGTLVAPLADKIFKGTPVGTIPVVTPESEFSINLKALARLGLTASEGLLSTADKIVH